MSKRVVAITGIGTLTPAGRGTGALWTAIVSGRTCLAPIDPQKYFDPSAHACQVAGQVPYFSEPRVLTESMMAQTDRCSQLALVAVLDALDMAQLPMDFRFAESPVAPERVSLTVAIIGAGWTYTEREMHNLWTKGVEAMSRYGTAGFPAGPQGHISILFGVQGRTRTFVSERVSGAHALIEGMKAIQHEKADIVIAGGTEAPLTPLTWAAYDSSHMLQPTGAVEESAQQPAGMLIGEGSTFLILEEREHALRRGVPILAEIGGWSRGTDPDALKGEGARKQQGRVLTRTIHASLAQAGIPPSAIDVIFPAGSALPEEDEAEDAAIQAVFEQSVPIATPKTVLGHLQGAAVATDVAVAVEALGRQSMPGSHMSESADYSMRHALILAGGLGGMHASLIVTAPES